MHGDASDQLSNQLRAWVRAAIEAENVGARRFEELHGLKKWSLRGFLDPDREQAPSLDRAKEICDALGIELHMGPPNSRIPLNPDKEAVEQGQNAELVYLDTEKKKEERLLQQAQEATQEFWNGLDPSNYVLVPLSQATLSAGAGASNPSEAIVDHLVFRQSWLRGLGVEPKHARLARVRGASMIPMIHDNDLVLIDTSKREVPVRMTSDHMPAKSTLYALTQDGEARVKWVQRPDEKTLILHSENSALHPPEYYTGHDAAEVNVIGKVLWWGHSVRD